MDITIAKSMLADAEALVIQLKTIIEDEAQAALPTEPCFIGRAVIISFVKTFGRSKPYTYVAVNPTGKGWYITGRKPADPVTGMSWAELVRFMASDEFSDAPKVYQSITQWKKA